MTDLYRLIQKYERRSIAASKGLEAFSVYSATKAAVRSFARCWTVDLKHRKIRVAVSPSVAWAAQTKSPELPFFSPPTTAAT
jgi:NAD(P)-dependent dehydrogenase (short-subunit alcohol dehydrogenase family)